MTKNRPWRITIDTNPDLCNYRCIMCDTHSRYNSEHRKRRPNMARELLQKVIREAKELGVKEIIPSTMGEPLLYEHFDLFIEELSSSDMKLNLTTNGSFPCKGVERWTELLMPILSDIKISLNSLQPEVNEGIMQNSNTEKTIDNILYMVKERNKLREKGLPLPTITIQVTFMKKNLNYFEEIIEFAVKHGIDRVKGHHLWVNWPDLESEALQNSSSGKKLWNVFIKQVDKYRELIKLVNFSPLDEGPDRENFSDKLECPFLDKELWVDHKGCYNVCCAPSKQRAGLGDFGSIGDKTIVELFNSRQYKELIADYKNRDVCKECPLRR